MNRANQEAPSSVNGNKNKSKQIWTSLTHVNPDMKLKIGNTGNNILRLACDSDVK